MFEKLIQQNKSSIGSGAQYFGRSLKERPPFLSSDNKLIFLCGANQEPGKPSQRRQSLKKFIEEKVKNCRVLYAEDMFSELVRNGSSHEKNILDMECDISKIADEVIIILESYSAFCELGAFSRDDFRGKLIIINDKKFKHEESFINKGPIKAAEESDAPVFWYSMTSNGLSELDAIGTVFSGIKNHLERDRKKNRCRADLFEKDDLNLSMNKESVYLLHDIVCLMGPVSYKEIVAFFVAAFGSRDYGILKRILGILRSSGFVISYESCARKGEWIYRSNSNVMFFEYEFDLSRIIAAARITNFRSNRERFCKLKR